MLARLAKPGSKSYKGAGGAPAPTHSDCRASARAGRRRAPTQAVLKRKLRRQLDHARPAAAEARIGLGLVGRLSDETLAARSRRNKEVRQSEVRVVENVEELRSQLQV